MGRGTALTSRTLAPEDGYVLGVGHAVTDVVVRLEGVTTRFGEIEAIAAVRGHGSHPRCALAGGRGSRQGRDPA